MCGGSEAVERKSERMDTAYSPRLHEEELSATAERIAPRISRALVAVGRMDESAWGTVPLRQRFSGGSRKEEWFSWRLVRTWEGRSEEHLN